MRKVLSGFMVAGALGLAVWLSLREDRIVISAPAWYAAPAPDRPTSKHDLTGPEVERGSVVRDELLADSPMKEMVSPNDLGAALKDSKREVVFEVEALINDKVARDVAEEIVVVAEKIWRSHQLSKNDPRTARSTLAIDEYVLAQWPSLSQLINDGAVQIAIRRNRHKREDGGAFSYTYLRDDKVLLVSLHLPNYAVKLTMNRQSGCPEIFDVIGKEFDRESKK